MIVHAENLVYRYETGRSQPESGGSSAPPALNGLSFTVESPSLVAILGPNGSGKSTLFRILASMLTPQKGRATVCGADVATQSMLVRAQIGVVFQEPSLDGHLTVRENLVYAGNLYGLSGSHLRKRVEAMADLLALGKHMEQFARTLSGGLRRRVEVARALLHQPKMLLLDEPSTGLDPEARSNLWQHLRSLHRGAGVAVLAVTHFLDEAEGCDRLLILHQGKLSTDGSPTVLTEAQGGEVVEVHTARAGELAAILRPRAGLHVTQVGDVVRVECPHGPSFIAQVAQSHGDWIHEVRMHRPSLADVYFHATGAIIHQ